MEIFTKLGLIKQPQHILFERKKSAVPLNKNREFNIINCTYCNITAVCVCAVFFLYLSPLSSNIND